jgi:lysophospholipase L1-like esterase
MYRITKSILRIIIGKHLRGYMKSRIPFLAKEEGIDMPNEAAIEKLSEEYATNLAKITQMGRGFGYRHLAVLQPALRSDRDCYTPTGRFHFSKRYIALYERFLEKAMQKLRKLNVAYYSAHLDFKEADTLYLDDIHLTGKGYRELAAATVKVLQEKGLIESRVEIETLERDRRHCP